MISANQVFANIQIEGAGTLAHVVWKIPADLPYLNGHFPQTPIFPAVGIVDASTVILQKALQLESLRVKSVVAAKFLSPITPDQIVRIDWHKVSETEWQVEWKENSTARKLATLNLQV